jgi:hypothetical protein
MSGSSYHARRDRCTLDVAVGLHRFAFLVLLPFGRPPSLPFSRTALTLASLVALPPMRPPRLPICDRYSLTVLGILLIFFVTLVEEGDQQFFKFCGVRRRQAVTAECKPLNLGSSSLRRTKAENSRLLNLIFRTLLSRLAVSLLVLIVTALYLRPL